MPISLQDMFKRRHELAAELATLDREIEAEALRLESNAEENAMYQDEMETDFPELREQHQKQKENQPRNAISIPKLIESEMRLNSEIAIFEAEITKRRDEKATISRTIEKEALRLARDREKMMDIEESPPDFSMFTDPTEQLLTEFWLAPKKMLSFQDIRDDVIFNPDAKENAIYDVIKEARREIKNHRDFHYVIRNVRAKGYRLVKKN